MRKSGSLLIPLALIIAYYAFWTAALWLLLARFPGVRSFVPLGGMDYLSSMDADSFEPVYSMIRYTVLSENGPVRLALASVGALVLTVPVSWVYFITSRERRIDQSFVQTILILPVVVTGIAMIVMNSLALAFSLAGVVAAVRFRFTLSRPSDAMYIFVAIAIGLGSGIGAVDIALVISAAFVFATLYIWKLEYGKTLAGPFLTMLTRRDPGDDDYE